MSDTASNNKNKEKKPNERYLKMKAEADAKLYNTEEVLYEVPFTYMKDTLIQLSFVAAILILVNIFLKYPIVGVMANFTTVFFAYNASQHWFYGRHSFLYLTNRRILGTMKGEEVDLSYGNIDEVNYQKGKIVILTKAYKLVTIRNTDELPYVLDFIQKRVNLKQQKGEN